MDKEDIIKGSERRDFPRAADNIFISYRSNSARLFKAITEDVGGGGLMFESERKIPVGTTLDMEICQPVNSFKTLIYVIPVAVKVVWTRRIKYDFLEMGENEYRIGVSFLKIAGGDRKKIIDYVLAKIR